MHPIPQPAPQRYSNLPFPPYRFILGENPHPTADPEGHSYGKEFEPPLLTVQNWSTHATYLYGVDLFNYAYWWETHEAFEGLWALYGRGSRESDYLQGLIKIAAALYKWHLRDARGVRSHYLGGTALLKKAQGVEPVYLGLNIAEFLSSVDRHFAKVFDGPGEWPDELVDYPFITLRFS